MLRLFASIAGLLGVATASTSSNSCISLFFDEPKCPKSLIEK